MVCTKGKILEILAPRSLVNAFPILPDVSSLHLSDSPYSKLSWKDTYNFLLCIFVSI